MGFSGVAEAERGGGGREGFPVAHTRTVPIWEYTPEDTMQFVLLLRQDRIK